MNPLLPLFRRELRARAHHLHPVVTVGQHGLTPRVLHEIDVALTAHELVKVRVFSDDRTEREAMLARISEQLACSPVQHLGKLLILWRRRADVAAGPAAERPPARTKIGRRPVSKGHAPVASASAHAVPGSRRRRRAPEPMTAGADQAMRRSARGKAPQGVPRAAAPRRRRAQRGEG
jgi:putative YhbY family RNA-binding protein